MDYLSLPPGHRSPTGDTDSWTTTRGRCDNDCSISSTSTSTSSSSGSSATGTSGTNKSSTSSTSSSGNSCSSNKSNNTDKNKASSFSSAASKAITRFFTCRSAPGNRSSKTAKAIKHLRTASTDKTTTTSGDSSTSTSSSSSSSSTYGDSSSSSSAVGRGSAEPSTDDTDMDIRRLPSLSSTPSSAKHARSEPNLRQNKRTVGYKCQRAWTENDKHRLTGDWLPPFVFAGVLTRSRSAKVGVKAGLAIRPSRSSRSFRHSTVRRTRRWLSLYRLYGLTQLASWKRPRNVLHPPQVDSVVPQSDF